MPPSDLLNQGLIKKHNANNWHYQEELHKRCFSSELLGATEDILSPVGLRLNVLFVCLFTLYGLSQRDIINSETFP